MRLAVLIFLCLFSRAFSALDPTKTSANIPTTHPANTWLTFYFTPRDSSGNAISADEAYNFHAYYMNMLNCASSDFSVSSSGGQYKADSPTYLVLSVTYMIHVQYKGIELAGSPSEVRLYSPATGASWASVSSMPSGTQAPGYTWTWSGSMRNSYGATQTCCSAQASQFTATFTSATNVLYATVSCQSGSLKYQFSTTVAGIYTVRVMFQGADLSGSPATNAITVTPAQVQIMVEARWLLTCASLLGGALNAYTGTVTRSSTGVATSATCGACSGSYYLLVITPTLAGTHVSRAMIGGTEISGSGTTSFEVTPAPANAGAVSFSGAPSPVTAGSTYTLTMLVNDIYGNNVPCASPAQAASLFTILWSGIALTSGFTWSCSGSNYVATGQPQTAGTFPIDMMVSGTLQTAQSAISLTVDPAAASATGCMFYGPTSVTAGDPYALTVLGFDVYGNAVPCSSTVLASNPFVATWAGDHITGDTWSCTADSPALFQTVFTKSTVGTYAVGLKVSGTAASQAALPVNIVAGPIVASTSVLTNPSSATACAPYTLTITAKDAYSNPVACASGTASTIFVVTWEGDVPSDLAWDCDSSQFRAQFTPRTPGTWELDVQRSGVTVGYNVPSPFSIPTVIGTPSASDTTYALSATSLTAGQPLTITTTVRDGCSNVLACTAPTAATTVALVWSGAAVTPSWSCSDGNDFVALISPTQAGDHTLGVTLGGTGVSTGNKTVQVVPGPVVAPQSSWIAPLTGTACTPYATTVRARDQFSNEVLCIDPSTAPSLFDLSWVGVTPSDLAWSCDITGGFVATFTPRVVGTQWINMTRAGVSPALTIGSSFNVPRQVTFQIGTLSANTTTYAPSSTTLTAGDTITLTATARDPCLNVLFCTEANKATVLSVAWGTDGGAPADLVWSCLAGTPTQFQASWAPTDAGMYDMAMMIAGGGTLSPGNVTVVVNPGPISAGDSTLVAASTTTAGLPYTATVHATDSHGNQVACTEATKASAIAVRWAGTVPTGIGWACTGDGDFRATWTPIQAAQYALIVELDWSGLAIDAFDVRVRPGPPSILTTLHIAAPLVPAGTPYPVLLAPRDAYDNPIPCSDLLPLPASLGLLWNGTLPPGLRLSCLAGGHRSLAAAGWHEHGVASEADGSWALGAGTATRVFVWVMPDPADPPSALVVQVRDAAGNETSQFYWGPYSPATTGPTPPRQGPLPTPGIWTRLVFQPPASFGALAEIRFRLLGGRAAFGPVGNLSDSMAGDGTAGPQTWFACLPTPPGTDHAWEGLAGSELMHPFAAGLPVGCGGGPAASGLEDVGAILAEVDVTAAGPARAALVVGGVAGPEWNLTVVPGNYDPARATYTARPSATTAGAPYTTTVTARDAYGNLVPCSNATAGAVFALTWDGAAPADLTWSCNGTTFVATFSPTLAGDHVVNLTCEGAPVPGGVVAVTIAPASPTVPTSAFLAAPSTVAGRPYLVLVALRDPYANPWPCPLPLPSQPLVPQLLWNGTAATDLGLGWSCASGGLRSPPAPALTAGWSFGNATANPLRAAGPSDRLAMWVYLHPASPPSHICLADAGMAAVGPACWHAAGNVSSPPLAQARTLGELPPPGSWQRVDVSAARLGIDGRNVTDWSVQVFGGQAALGPTGLLSTAPAPWFECSVPQGATITTTSGPASAGWATLASFELLDPFAAPGTTGMAGDPVGCGQSPIFMAQFTPTRTGRVSLRLAAPAANWAQEDDWVTVVPAPCQAATSEVPPVAGPTTAGAPYTTTVTARDAYGNLVPCSNATAGAVFDLTWDGAAPADLIWSCNGTAFVATFSPTLAGPHYLTVTRATDGCTVATGGAQTVTVVPAPSDPAQASINSAPPVIVAGDPDCTSLTARDAYGNLVPCSNATAADTFDLAWDGAAPADLTWSCNGTAFVATFSPTLAGPHNLTVTGAGAVAGLVPGAHDLDIVVVPAPTVAATSSLVQPPVTTAGAPYTTTVTARDAYGNLVPCSNATAGATFGLAWDGAAPADLTWSCNGTAFAATFSPTLAGPHNLTVTFGADRVAPAESGPVMIVLPGQILRVIPSCEYHSKLSSHPAHRIPIQNFPAPGAGNHVSARGQSASNPAHCILSPPMSPTTAGAPYTTTVTARDVYGNLVPCSNATAGATFDLTWDGAAPADLTWSCNATTGDFLATFSPTLAGPHNLTVTGAGAIAGVVPGAHAVAIVVVPAPVSGPECEFAPPLAGSTTAGAPYTTTVTARDAYGNLVPCSNATVGATFALAWDGAAPADLTWSCNGTAFLATLSPTLAGPHNLTVTGAADGVLVGQNGMVAVTVVPGPECNPQWNRILHPVWDASQSSIRPASTWTTAGAPYTTTVTSRDAYGNLVPCSNATAAGTFALTWDGAAPADLTWSCNGTAFLATFSPTLAGPHNLTLTGATDGTLIHNGSRVTVVVPAAVSGPECEFAPPLAGSTTAGAPYTTTVTARDAYGNLVPCSNATAGATFALTWDGAAPADLTWSCNGTAFVATFSPTLAGPHNLTVTVLPPGDMGWIENVRTRVGVQPACIDPGSSLTQFNTTAIQGTPHTTTVMARDAYGNLVPCSNATVGATFGLAWDGAAPADLTWSCNGTAFVATFSPVDDANHTLRVATLVDGRNVTGGSNVQVTVVPARIHRRSLHTGIDTTILFCLCLRVQPEYIDDLSRIDTTILFILATGILTAKADRPSALVFTRVALTSTNPAAHWARPGDWLCLNLTANLPLMGPPSLLLAGEPVLATGAGTHWSAARQLGPTDPEGPLGFAVTAAWDRTGRVALAARPVINCTAQEAEQCRIVYDRTAPRLEEVVFTSSNVNPRIASPGDTVALRFIASETLQYSIDNGSRPAVSIADRPAVVRPLTADLRAFAAEVTLAVWDPLGPVAFAVDNLWDPAGNPGQPASNATQGPSVIFYGSACTIDADCGPPGGRCVPNGLVFVCRCPPGWSGPQCQVLEGNCTSDADCQHSGRCLGAPPARNCTCELGWAGSQCQDQVDDVFYCHTDPECRLAGDKGATCAANETAVAADAGGWRAVRVWTCRCSEGVKGGGTSGQACTPNSLGWLVPVVAGPAHGLVIVPAAFINATSSPTTVSGIIASNPLIHSPKSPSPLTIENPEGLPDDLNPVFDFAEGDLPAGGDPGLVVASTAGERHFAASDGDLGMVVASAAGARQSAVSDLVRDALALPKPPTAARGRAARPRLAALSPAPEGLPSAVVTVDDLASALPTLVPNAAAAQSDGHATVEAALLGAYSPRLSPQGVGLAALQMAASCDDDEKPAAGNDEELERLRVPAADPPKDHHTAAGGEGPAPIRLLLQQLMAKAHSSWLPGRPPVPSPPTEPPQGPAPMARDPTLKQSDTQLLPPPAQPPQRRALGSLALSLLALPTAHSPPPPAFEPKHQLPAPESSALLALLEPLPSPPPPPFEAAPTSNHRPAAPLLVPWEPLPPARNSPPPVTQADPGELAAFLRLPARGAVVTAAPPQVSLLPALTLADTTASPPANTENAVTAPALVADGVDDDDGNSLSRTIGLRLVGPHPAAVHSPSLRRLERPAQPSSSSPRLALAPSRLLAPDVPSSVAPALTMRSNDDGDENVAAPDRTPQEIVGTAVSV
ncbi:hypothetical protein PAPYR_8761 [Paratrimastix pyriformis]|uniref:EGF-like domain-containing protein n=1 Tax=Paratrimastix pyriformis TaxID=342808 RepID=A0ABQ8UFL3_9EUKA|nr:hypothetical protein PAPYR_8761 [Paratrimastix pyriformis]